jgi:hypothetical protein
MGSVADAAGRVQQIGYAALAARRALETCVPCG